MLDPKKEAIDGAMTAILDLPVGAMGVELPKILADLFDAGGAEYGMALQRAMHTMQSSLASQFVSPSLIGGGRTISETPPTAGAPGKDGRAPRGSVRKAVVAVLVDYPAGITAAELIRLASEIDPSISASGINNEITRNRNKIYLSEGGRWQLMPGLTLGGHFHGLNKES